MRIQINDEYYITTDKYNFILMRDTLVTDESSKNFGNIKSEVIGYYGRIKQCIEPLIRHLVLTSDVASVAEIAVMLAEFEESIEIKIMEVAGDVSL